MGILSRFKEIMSSNINAILDKMEDPSKMIDQLVRELNDDLAKVKTETASIMAEEQRCKRQIDDCDAEIAKYQKYAEKAVVAGNDDDARAFLQKKSTVSSARPGLQEAYDAAAANSAKMRQMYDKLTSQLDELNARRQSVKAKVAVAQAQERINKMTSSIDNAADSMSAFDRMEEKADKMLDTANAMAELNKTSGDRVDELTEKYDARGAEVDDELAALKQKLGK